MKKWLVCLAKYQAKPENGPGSFPLYKSHPKTEDGKLGQYIYGRLSPNFYAGKLLEETVRELYEVYGLEEFDPAKLDKIIEVNKLELGELKEQCEDNGVIYKKKTKHGYKSLLDLDTIRRKLAKHITRPEASIFYVV